MNGINTQGENIADNGGIKEAYLAYEKWAKSHTAEPRLPGLTEYTPRQMFWLSAANTWCSKYRPGKDENFNIGTKIVNYHIIGCFCMMFIYLPIEIFLNF